MGKMIWYG